MDLHVEFASGRPKRYQLEEALRDAIRSGRLRTSAVLPASRALAEQLGISRGVVVSAYAELAAEGLVRSRSGSRTRVAERRYGSTAPEVNYHPRGYVFDLRPGLPDLAQFPRAAWGRALQKAMRTMPIEDLGYANYNGLPVLRIALAEYLDRARATRADPEQILITSGVGHGLLQACIALRRLGARRIGVESPGWRWQLEIARQAGLQPVPVPVPVDSGGPLPAVVTGSNLDALFLTPSHQFPLGTTLARARQRELLQWAREHDAYLLEDDYDAEYQFVDQPRASLQGLDPDRVIYAGTVSKSLAPGLRLGWLHIPQRLLDEISDVRFATLSTVSSLEQTALADFISTGAFDRHLRGSRHRYRARRHALLEALDAQLPELAVGVTGTGLHLYLPLPDEVAEFDVAAQAQAVDVGVYGLRQVASVNDDRQALLLGFARLAPHRAASAIALLARALDSHGPAGQPTW